MKASTRPIASGVTGTRRQVPVSAAPPRRAAPSPRRSAPSPTSSRPRSGWPGRGCTGGTPRRRCAAMPPTRSGHISDSSVHPGAAAQDSSRPMTSSGTAALPWVATSAVSRNRLWLLPPMARATAPQVPSSRGWASAPGPVPAGAACALRAAGTGRCTACRSMSHLLRVDGCHSVIDAPGRTCTCSARGGAWPTHRRGDSGPAQAGRRCSARTARSSSRRTGRSASTTWSTRGCGARGAAAAAATRRASPSSRGSSLDSTSPSL